jgi:hypothetical protein
MAVPGKKSIFKNPVVKWGLILGAIGLALWKFGLVNKIKGLFTKKDETQA